MICINTAEDLIKVLLIIVICFFIGWFVMDTYDKTTKPWNFCNEHKPSEDYEVVRASTSLGNVELICDFETLPELEFKEAYSKYKITKNHGYVCDFWCFGDEYD